MRASPADALAPLRPEPFRPGGFGGLQRAQYTFTPTSSDGDYGTIKLPRTPPIASYMIPLTVQKFDESDGARYQLLGDGLVTVVRDGLYELTANYDWPAQSRGSGQDGYDTDLRQILVKRVRVGVQPPPYRPGQVTFLPHNGSAYDAMANHDTPGSSAPNAVRATVPWPTRTIAAGGMASLDVAMTAGSFSPDVGDLARASLTSLSDQMLGAANAGLSISARVVAPLLVRVVVENRYNTEPVTVQAGTLNVIAESAVSSGGNSTDAQAWVNSGPVEIFAGEKIFVGARSHTNGDYIQISNLTFLRITNLVP